MESIKDWHRRIEEESDEICKNDDPLRKIAVHKFVSRSRGGHRNKIVKKNGKIYGPYPYYGPYKRKHWREYTLIRYNMPRWYSWPKFPFGGFVNEILGGDHYGNDLRDMIVDKDGW